MYPYPNYPISRNSLKESNDQRWVQKEPTTDPLKSKWKKKTNRHNTNITQTSPCNIQQYFTAVKLFIFR